MRLSHIGTLLAGGALTLATALSSAAAHPLDGLAHEVRVVVLQRGLGPPDVAEGGKSVHAGEQSVGGWRSARSGAIWGRRTGASRWGGFRRVGRCRHSPLVELVPRLHEEGVVHAPV